MKKSDEKFMKNWKKTKESGFKKYALTHGLGFGIIMTVFNLIWLNYNQEQSIEIDQFIITGIVMIFVGGFTYAGITWLMNEYIYKKKVEKK
ncbi:hypothetical protein [Psychroflexus planctonicus]|uniref:2TM domain-containing protein n=1 Tax=Psychroflexus planctonicus TaxID=1526575 RepID=A0ABQ1SJP2_9FLAO|nr:hypothetical protein [Psychroflexus planctonicus]GGE37742.1 hypothetical protein GCM10010832_17500 [Psychroflexus planctonicus]